MPALTYILVHGALLTSAAWMPVQSHLQNRDFNVITIDVPGRAEDNISPKEVTLDAAADKVCRVASLQSDKVILVGHSQGGAVITQAVSQCGEQIAALVYVAAVVPASGEKAFDLLSEKDGENFDKVASLNPEAGLYQINHRGPIKAMFMEDASEEQARRAIHNMVNEPVRLGDDKLHYDEQQFADIPKFYIRTTFDKIISPETQSKYLSRTPFKKIMVMNSSHSPFVSQAKLLSQHLAAVNEILAAK